MINLVKEGKRRGSSMTSRHKALLPFVSFADHARKLFVHLQLKQWQKPVEATPHKKLTSTTVRYTSYLTEPGMKPSLLNRLTGSVLSECAKQPESYHDLMEMLSAYSKERSFLFDLGELLKRNGWIEIRFIASRMYVKITMCGLAHIQTTSATTGE